MGQCLTPLQIRKKHSTDWALVPCGKCPACASRRATQWAFRLNQQEKISISAYFITLTYATDHVPICKNGQLSVRKTDLQLFFKRLRKIHGLEHPKYEETNPIKYYAVAEYGEKSGRPHYHVIMFNARIELVAKAWKLGEMHYGQVTGGSVAYTLKYLQKPRTAGTQPGDERQREFSLMSKGLGANYINEKMVKWHKADYYQRLYVVEKDGKKISMPRYYKEKIFDEETLRKSSQYQQQKIQEAEQKLIEKFGGVTEYEVWKIKKTEAAIRKQNYSHKLQKL